MSVKSSFFFLTMLTFLVAIGVEAFIWVNERDNVNAMAKQNAQEIVQGFKQLLILKSDSFKKQALDYAAWNDLANFTDTKDPQWAEDNLRASIVQFGIDGMYILDQNKKIIFSESDKPFLATIETLVPFAMFDTANAELLHFYVKVPQQGIVECYVAPIHRIDETIAQNSLAKGFVLIVKHWDEAFLKELSGYGIAEASLSAIQNDDDYNTVHEIPLSGIQGEKVGTLYLHIHNRMSEVLDRYGKKELKLTIVHTVILMIVFALLIAKFISFPLRDITVALNAKNKEPLRKYLLKENEYGAISTALCESFDTKEELEYLNKNLEKKIDEEVANSRLKDRMLFQQAKLAALGEMLGNIAHQWRQPLNTISVVISKIYLDSQMKKLTPQNLEDEIVKLRSLIQSMSSTIDDFKDFFLADTGKVLFSVSKCIEESIRMNDGGIANRDILFCVDCPQEIALNTFKKELGHVLLVLIHNAKEALIERQIAHGEITIKGYEQEHYVIIEVSDNGGGVTDEQLPHVFDPFFTTKDPTRGNGGGLYMSKQIIEQTMQGSINATNERGGLFITIVLPKDEA
ncbi:putative two-component sensor histidine kinase [Sulfurospirillum diekertiae]|uniref:histidine kinase n=1 Tax=Sulfurospirillum diekertiae TaxID=1854492 RepID=A0A290HUW1_9BACT|nr:ATP-binding protein [Sulfurospirillum diekertiae]ATB70434.1 putative two-component sensor histidine kinase [Sulfurospirillum diekertiae]